MSFRGSQRASAHLGDLPDIGGAIPGTFQRRNTPRDMPGSSGTSPRTNSRSPADLSPTGSQQQQPLPRTQSGTLPPLPATGSWVAASQKEKESQRGWGMGEGEVAELLVSARQIARETGDKEADLWAGISARASLRSPPRRADVGGESSRHLGVSLRHSQSSDSGVIDSLHAATTPTSGPDRPSRPSSTRATGSARTPTGESKAMVTSTDPKIVALRTPMSAFGVDDDLDAEQPPLPQPDPLFRFDINLMTAAGGVTTILLLSLLVPLGVTGNDGFVEALPFAVAVWGVATAALSIMLGEQVGIICGTDLSGSLLAFPFLLLGSLTAGTITLLDELPTLVLIAITLALLALVIPLAALALAPPTDRSMGAVPSFFWAGLVTTMGVVIPLACGAGLVSAVKATSDESAQLGAVIVFSLMLRLHVHVLMPLLTRDDVEDVHMQCRVFTLQMVTPLFTAVLWSESTSWLLLLGLLALQSLETLTRLAVHESKVRHRVRTGEALVGTQLLCTVVGAITCDWACCGPSCMQHCPGVKGTGPFVEWQMASDRSVRPDVEMGASARTKSFHAQQKKSKKKRRVRLQTMTDRYVLVEMGLRAPLALVMSLAGIGLVILARHGTNSVYYPAFVSPRMTDDGMWRAVIFLAVWLGWKLIEAGLVMGWYTHRSVLRVNAFTVARKHADAALIHLTAPCAAAIALWLVLKHIGIVDEL